jgi:hypothetical protein
VGIFIRFCVARPQIRLVAHFLYKSGKFVSGKNKSFTAAFFSIRKEQKGSSRGRRLSSAPFN